MTWVGAPFGRCSHWNVHDILSRQRMQPQAWKMPQLVVSPVARVAIGRESTLSRVPRRSASARAAAYWNIWLPRPSVSRTYIMTRVPARGFRKDADQTTAAVASDWARRRRGIARSVSASTAFLQRTAQPRLIPVSAADGVDG